MFQRWLGLHEHMAVHPGWHKISDIAVTSTVKKIDRTIVEKRFKNVICPTDTKKAKQPPDGADEAAKDASLQSDS